MEGDSSAGAEEIEQREYEFASIGLNLYDGVRSQLKYQQNKLTGGAIAKSTGTRAKNWNQDMLDKDADYNLDKSSLDDV